MNSPFKFLDAYAKADKDIFFGREAETEQLFTLVFRDNIVLLYGPSGTGKTSLIQCGLGNRFRDTDWLPLFVRRRHDINQSLRDEIDRSAKTPIAPDASLVKAVKSLYLDHLRPVYLVFDQFEELFVLGSPEEQQRFIDGIAALLASEVACKIILCMREEYIAALYGFEKAVPTLFSSRLRVEPMSLANIRQVITGTAEKFGIVLEDGVSTAEKIIDHLRDRKSGVQLSYLQVYLDKLYRGATGGQPPPAGTPVLFSNRLVDETGELGDVLAAFVGEQTRAIQQRLAAEHPDLDPEAVQHLLEAFTTLEGTKQPMSRADLAAQMPALAPVLDDMLAALRSARILRPSDGLDELAHDTLGVSIAERRNDHRKTVLRLKKIVTDLAADFPKGKTYLSRQQLAMLRPYESELGLSPDESRFVTRSRGLAGWQRVRAAVFVLLAIVVVAPLAAYAVSPDIRTFVAYPRASLALAGVPDADWVNEPDRDSQQFYLDLARSFSDQEMVELADKRIPKVLFLIAKKYYIENKNELYFREMKKAADAGLPIAEYDLGTAYENGIGVPESTEFAQRYYKRSAAKGNVLAMEAILNDLFNNDKIPEATALVNRSLEGHPDAPVLWIARADINTLNGCGEAAAADFRMARKHSEGQPKFLKELCRTKAIRNFQVESGLADCDAASKALARLSAAPRDVSRLGPNALVLANVAREEAEERWRILEGDIADSRGLALFQLGRFREALSAYNDAVALRPGDSDDEYVRQDAATSLYGRSLTHLALNDRAASDRDLAAARALDPEIDDSRFQGGWTVSATAGQAVGLIGAPPPACPGPPSGRVADRQ